MELARRLSAVVGGMGHRGAVFRRSVRVLGLRYTCRLYGANRIRPSDHAYDEPFDDRWDVQTDGTWKYEPGDVPGDVDGAAEGYEGTRVDVVRYAFGLLPIDVRTAELWDLGSGKGRVVIFAAAAGFKRVVGVELNEELHEIATANVARIRSEFPHSSIELLSASATDITLPDVPLVVFMFNPFRGRTFHEVVQVLEKRAARSEAPVWVIYVNPKESAQLENSSFFELVSEEKIVPRWWSMNLYRST